MQTTLTKLLNIQYPIIQGAMAWISESKLVSAVANAGATGVIAAGGRDENWLRDEIRKTKQMTDRPFGVNVMLMADNKDQIADVICEEQVAFVTLGAGNPVPYIKRFQQAGIKAIPVVPNLKLAKRIEDSGADAIIVEGMEAGGHIGTQTTMALMTNVLPAIKIPVIVAGGIVDGRGIAAALVMGASGAQLGTRFLVTNECLLHPKAKQRILDATDTDSVITGLRSGHGVRGIRNSFTDRYIELERQGTPQAELDRMATGTNRLGAIDGDVENGLVQAGQSLAVLTSIKSVKETVETLITETREALTKASHMI